MFNSHAMSLGNNIRRHRERLGLTLEQLAERSGVEVGTISALEVRNSTRSKFAVPLAAALGVPLERLLTEQDEAHDLGVDVPEVESDPRFMAVRKVVFKISAGIAGFAVEYLDNGDGEPLFISSAWIRARRLDATKLYAVRVNGDSMAPTLNEGDIIVVNTADQKREEGAVFAANHEGEFTVKRLRKDMRRWMLASDNLDQRSYPPRECTEHTYLLGKVVYRQGESI